MLNLPSLRKDFVSSASTSPPQSIFLTVSLRRAPACSATQVCSASQMTSLSADDIFNKLRFLLFVVSALFGGMNLGAGVAWAVDFKSRRALLTRIQVTPP